MWAHKNLFVRSAGHMFAALASVAIVPCYCESSQGESSQSSNLNQIPGKRQSLEEWSFAYDAWSNTHFVQSKSDARARWRAPDGSNFVNGVAHPPFIRQDNWAQLKQQYRARPGDIHVVTFPKCGTTFTEQIVLLLLNGGDASQLNPKRQNSYDPAHPDRRGKVWAEARVRVAHRRNEGPGEPRQRPLSLEDFDALPSPRVLKTHAPRELFLATTPLSPPSLSNNSRSRPEPLAPGVKVVYCSRRAKDAAVSAYYHAASPHRLGFPFDAWAATWLSGLFEHGRWSDHVAGWRAEWLQNPRQVIWLKYEDLVARPHEEIKRLAAFLDVDASDDLVERVVESSSFGAMKEQSGNSHFFRKGVVGDSARHFSPALESEFDAALAEQMRGVDDPYSPP
jgi:hypothetical protein